MKFMKNGESVYEYAPSYSGKNILVSIDSSKSDTAMFVWDEYGHPLDDYEIIGAGSDIGVYDLCWRTRIELQKLFSGANILRVGIEDIITKKEAGYKGIEIHQSRYKITAVFDNLVFFFQIFHNQTPRMINNWSWKSSVLPEDLRKKDVKKGSTEYCKRLGNRWAGRNDNVTDAYCIGLYLLMSEKIESVYYLEYTEPGRVKYDYGIFPESFPLPSGSKNFIIKNNDTLQHNIETIANKVVTGQPGCVKADISLLSLEDVYSEHARFASNYKYTLVDNQVLVVVFRKE